MYTHNIPDEHKLRVMSFEDREPHIVAEQIDDWHLELTTELERQIIIKDKLICSHNGLLVVLVFYTYGEYLQ